MTEQVREVLGRVAPSIEWSKVADDGSLSGAGLDSLDKASVIMELETLWSTKISDDRYEHLDTIRDIATLRP